MEQLDNIISKQPDKMTAIEYTIWRLWLTSQNNNPKGESNQKTIYDAQRAAQDLARITDERDALKIELQATAKHKLRDGSYCWCDKAEYEMNPEYGHAAFCYAHRAALKQSS